MITRRTGLKLLLAASVTPLAACEGPMSGGLGTSGSVLDAARSRGGGSFVRALDIAGLSGTLSGAGPYTIFAPADAAMSAAGLPSDRDALQEILAYHVVPGDFSGSFLEGVDVNYTTLSGASLNVDGTGGGLLVNGANVVSADNTARNGVVHVIDRVLRPG